MFNPSDFPTPTMIEANGVKLEVFEAGKENKGNPIVLCHGWPEHAFTWRHQMPVLAEAGYHVIVPNQRGYGNSVAPQEVEEYDIACLTGDLAGLLDHFGYDDAVFVGHDWGANVVWSMAMLHPKRVSKLVALALPYQERGEMPWVQFLSMLFGDDHYMVDFNKRPGVADAVLNDNADQFLRNLYRKNVPPVAPAPGNYMINLANEETALGEPIMSDDELNIFVRAFEQTGFEGSINWYRNLDRNWQLLANVEPIITQEALMIYGEQDMIPKSPTLSNFVPNVTETSLDCGHWVQQEMPSETSKLILDWLANSE